MANKNNNEFTGSVLMIREFLLYKLESDGTTKNFLRNKIGFKSPSQIERIISEQSASVETVEQIMQYYGINYTDLEQWYEDYTVAKKKSQ